MRNCWDDRFANNDKKDMRPNDIAEEKLLNSLRAYDAPNERDLGLTPCQIKRMRSAEYENDEMEKKGIQSAEDKFLHK